MFSQMIRTKPVYKHSLVELAERNGHAAILKLFT